MGVQIDGQVRYDVSVNWSGSAGGYVASVQIVGGWLELGVFDTYRQAVERLRYVNR